MSVPDQGETRDEYERRAPGWVVRCLKCGFTQPWGKYGIRIDGAGRPRTWGWCSRCRWIRCHVIETRVPGGR